MPAIDLQAKAVACLIESDPGAKCDAVFALYALLDGEHALNWPSEQSAAIDVPGKPEKPRCVHPRDLTRRGSGSLAGRIVLLHAIAHIEFNAINLALDAVVRFEGLPPDYYRDWIGVAADEARHFTLLSNRLADLDAKYGDFPAHQGLWDMALRTAADPLDRMAMVPRIMEARGLDVTPAMIEKFKRAGDDQSADLLSTILREEIDHVKAGTHWFEYLCAQRGLAAESTWIERVSHYLGTNILCPVNLKDRAQAGFKEGEIQWLKQVCRNRAISS